jgi:hypothetical protein
MNIRWCRWCGAMVVPEIDHGVRTDDWIHIEDVGEPGGESECSFEQPLYRNHKWGTAQTFRKLRSNI